MAIPVPKLSLCTPPSALANLEASRILSHRFWRERRGLAIRVVPLDGEGAVAVVGFHHTRVPLLVIGIEALHLLSDSERSSRGISTTTRANWSALIQHVRRSGAE